MDENKKIGEVKVVTTPGYLDVLRNEKKLTIATIIDGHESHHQIDVMEFDTREKIEAEMARILIQVSEELQASNNAKRKQPISQDIQQLVEEHKLENEK